MRVDVSFVSANEVVSTSRRWLAIPGLGCVVAAVIGTGLTLGNVALPAISSTPRQISVAAAGLVLIFLSFVKVGGSAVDVDPALWEKIFEAMPPAFVKEYPNDAHVRDNHALRTLQGHKPKDPIGGNDFHAAINADHRAGDLIAANTGASVQLEYSDQYSTKYPQLILTFKTRVEHAGKTYIVGWYVPVERPDKLPELDILDVRKSGEQIVFRVTPTAADTNPFVVNVGRALRTRR